MVWVVFIGFMLVAAASGAFFSPGAWYEDLHKPSWTPPNWAFPLVWGALYVAIIWAGVLAWRGEGNEVALAFWFAQWVFNTAWSWLFFGRRRMDLAFVDICLLWLTITGFTIAAWSVSPLASLLFLPYLAWVTVAATLNVTVWRLNPGANRTA